MINLFSVYNYAPSFYPALTLHIPSLLNSLEMIHKEEPTQIIISTPGPVGLIGVLAARLLGVKCTGIYHSDFTQQIECDVGGKFLPDFLERYVKWFYNQLDDIRVPSHRYIENLSRRGFEQKKMRIYQRGIDIKTFKYDEEAKEQMRRILKLKDGFYLLYVGRMSKDKNSDFLVRYYKALMKEYKDVYLILTGTGPDLKTMKNQLAGLPHVRFTGPMRNLDLPGLYSLADLFVFPSTTDTFGMTVLEAQACGLPALVSDQGGPQEIIVAERSGFVLSVTDEYAWVQATMKLMQMKAHRYDAFWQMRVEARKNVLARYRWDASVEDILEISQESSQNGSQITRFDPRMLEENTLS
jgi:glycosyltransferase involved in cell wall biosynthesis